jgi:hypothetical protein
MTAPGQLSDQQVAIVAADAGLDPRTVRRALTHGSRTRSALTRQQIALSLRKFGHVHHAIRIEQAARAHEKRARA